MAWVEEMSADTPRGAVANVVMYSLIESATINDLNVLKYIEYLLEELPKLENPTDESTLSNFLPWSETLPVNLRNINSEILSVNKNLIL